MTKTEALRRIKQMNGVTARVTVCGNELRVTYTLQEIVRRYPELKTRRQWIEKAEALAYYDDDPETVLRAALQMAEKGKQA